MKMKMTRHADSDSDGFLSDDLPLFPYLILPRCTNISDLSILYHSTVSTYVVYLYSTE